MIHSLGEIGENQAGEENDRKEKVFELTLGGEL